MNRLIPRRRGDMLLLAGLLPALLAASACSRETVPETDQTVASATATATTIATAQLRPVPVVTEATGSVEPWRRVSPGTKIMGRIDSFPVREGDHVDKGQVLVLLEKRDLEAAVRQARAGIAMAQARLENARAQQERIAGLHDRGSATDKNLEDATAGLRVAQAALEQARANLQAAEVTLEYARIRAPVSGWVVRKMAEAGDLTAPGVPLLTIEDVSRVKINVQVPEAAVVGMHAGDPVRVRIDVLDRELEATIDRIAPAADQGSRTFDVKIVLENRDNRIKAGLFARALFPRGSRDALTVPTTALVTRGQLRGLWVVGDDSVARLRWVKAGRSRDGRVEILSGLDPGERYLPSPPAGLVDGAPVLER